MDLEPFATQNKQLALALATAGCKFADQNVGGPAQNCYTLNFLRSRKIGKGKHIEDAVREAVDRKIPGKVTYFFEHNETLVKAIAAWDATVKEFQLANHEGRHPRFPDLDTSMVAQVMCVAANNLKAFDDELPWINNPICSTLEFDEKEVPIDGKPAPKTVSSGTGKVWTLGASKFVKDKLKIK